MRSKVFLLHPGKDEVKNEFAVRLIGRIIFCWFLREKRNMNGIGLIPESILSREAAGEKQYYHQTLAPLFFEVLNKPLRMRQNQFKIEDMQFVPYLNGGLFEPDENDHYEYDDAARVSKSDLVDVPDQWLRKLFELLESYNFTIDENTTYDVDLSIDPEMLGRIFENLLARINPETGETVRKATGSFYTPREIVEYMVDASLKQFLMDKTGIDEKKIAAAVSYDLLDDLQYPLTATEKEKMVDALSKAKILDPACGSGAFPIGIMQKIVFVLQQVDPHSRIWMDKQLLDIAPEVKALIEREISNKNFDYVRKLGVIRNSIYGVDIQPVATEISRLRCFLTLMVDQPIDDSAENRGIEPLPNLDFKFVAANSLINLPDASNQASATSAMQTTIFEEHAHIEHMKKIMDNYFNAPINKRKDLQAEFKILQKKMDGRNEELYQGQASFSYNELSRWDPFGHKAVDWFDPKWMFGIKTFDIVIGNPPYVQLQKNGGELAKKYIDQSFESFASMGDIYQLFYEKGLNLLNESGVLCYITSNKWLRTAYGQKSRQLFADCAKIIQLIDLGPGVFQATVDTNILLLQAPGGKHIPARACKIDDGYFSVEKITEENVSLNIPANGSSWLILNPIEKRIKEKIERVGVPLKEWDINIYRGVLTGYNDAFIIDNATKDRLVAEDPKSVEILKPILRGRDIRRYHADWAGLWLIDTHNGYDSIPPVDVGRYTAVKRYLDEHWDKIASRQDKGITPYNLRNCAYHEEFGRDKIIYQEIVHESPAFFYDNTKNYYVEASAFLMTGNNLGYMLLFLNSQLGYYLFKTFYSGGGLGSQGIRYKKHYLEKMHVPRINPSFSETISDLFNRVVYVQNGQMELSHVNKLDQEINRFFYKLFDFTELEIRTIRDSMRT